MTTPDETSSRERNDNECILIAVLGRFLMIQGHLLAFLKAKSAAP